MKYLFDAACSCNIGRIRKNNEDNFYFNGSFLNEDNTGLNEILYFRSALGTVCFAVFDGIGGSDDGQVAAYIAAKEFGQYCQSAEPDNLLLSEMFFDSAIQKMNEKVLETATKNKNNMGSTAAILVLSDKKIYVANLGDSRIYRIRDHNITQISVDQVSETGYYANKTYRKKPALRQYLGMDSPEPYISQGFFRPGDAFLLCTDGLTDMVSREELLKIIEKTTDVRECVKTLLQQALENGGRDNVTMIFLRISNDEFTQWEQ